MVDGWMDGGLSRAIKERERARVETRLGVLSFVWPESLIAVHRLVGLARGFVITYTCGVVFFFFFFLFFVRRLLLLCVVAINLEVWGRKVML